MENLNQHLERKYPLLWCFSGRKSNDGKRDWPEWWEELPDAPRTGVLPVKISTEALQQWAKWEQESLGDPVYALPREQGGVWFAFGSWQEKWQRTAEIFARHLELVDQRNAWQLPGVSALQDPVLKAVRIVQSFENWLEVSPKRQPQKRRGRKREYDPKKDARLVRDWEAARNQGQTKAGFCRERGIDVRELELTLARHRQRKTREP